MRPLLGVPDAAGDRIGRELERLLALPDEDGEVQAAEQAPLRGHRKRCAICRSCLRVSALKQQAFRQLPYKLAQTTVQDTCAALTFEIRMCARAQPWQQ